jgi:hypothetical protein
VKPLLFSILALFPIFGTPLPQGDGKKFGYRTEGVKVSYTLLLDKCTATSCHLENAGQADAYINLTAEDSTFSWGYGTMDEHSGNVEYQLRFKVSRTLKDKQFERSFVVGFSGRIGTLTGKQVTWPEKGFRGKNWDSFKMSSVSGPSYPEDGETITPTLQVRQIELLSY